MLRGFFLALKRDIVNAFKECTLCGARGVQGLTYTRYTCDTCARAYQEALDTLHSTNKVEEFIITYGKKELFRTFGDINMNPLADQEEDLEEEEVPCFDTYPAAPPPPLYWNGSAWVPKHSSVVDPHGWN